jgi:hypothetical protein
MTRALRLVFLALLVALVVHNVAWLDENQSEALPCRLRVWCGKSRDIASLSETQASRKIREVHTHFYVLGNRIPGARLTIPAWMEIHRWELEHVSRLRITVSDEPLLVGPAHVAALRKAGGPRRGFMRRGEDVAKPRFQNLYVLIEDGLDEYVLAQEKATEGGALFVMPAARYEEVRLR